MTMSEAEVSGATGAIVEALKAAAPELKRYNIDGMAEAAKLSAERAACEAENKEQEAMKRALLAKTARKDAMFHNMWVRGSGLLDMVIAAVMKDSPAAENFRRIRSRVSRPTPEEAKPLPVENPVQTR